MVDQASLTCSVIIELSTYSLALLRIKISISVASRAIVKC